MFFNLFRVIGFLLYTLKTSENFWFSDILKEYSKKEMAWHGLICI